jgi:hypothetical protein
MWQVCTKLIPWLLTVEQKENQTNFCKDLLQQDKADMNFTKLIITGDKTWV